MFLAFAELGEIAQHQMTGLASALGKSPLSIAKAFGFMRSMHSRKRQISLA